MHSMFQLPAWLRTRTRKLGQDPLASEAGTSPETPVDRGRARVRLPAADNITRPVIDLVRPHLATRDCLIVTGYHDFLSSLAVILREVPLLAQAPNDRTGGARSKIRIAYGVDTASATRLPGRGRGRAAGDEARRYFLERHGLAIEDTPDLMAVVAMGAIARGEIDLRVFDAAKASDVLGLSQARRLHAKVITSPIGGIAGSANFSRSGLYLNVEYDDDLRVDADDEMVRAGAKGRQAFSETIWDVSTDWNQEALEVLRRLLRPVSAEDAVARTVAEQKGFRPWRIDLLENPAAVTGYPPLPYQVDLIYEAASIVYEHGFALVSAPAGSGKTQVGMQLGYVLSETFRGVVAGDDTGGIPRGGAVVIAPPKVVKNWSVGSRHLRAIPNTKVAVRGSGDANARDKFRRDLEEAGVILLDESHTVTPAFINPSNRSLAVEFAPPAWGVCLSATLLGNNDVDWLTHLQEKRASIFMSPAYNAEMKSVFKLEGKGRNEDPIFLAEQALNPLKETETGLSDETRAKLAEMLSPFLAHRQRSCIGERDGKSTTLGRYPAITYHGRPSELLISDAQEKAIEQVARLASDLAPGKRLTSRETGRFGTLAEFRHNQNSLYARNLLNIVRASSELALWQMEHGAIGRNLRNFEVEDRARSRSAPRREDRQGNLFEDMVEEIAPDTPKCDELTRLLRTCSIQRLDGKRIKAARKI